MHLHYLIIVYIGTKGERLSGSLCTRLPYFAGQKTYKKHTENGLYATVFDIGS